MTFSRMTASAISVGAVFAANAALADVTAQEVWDNWSEAMEIYGEGGFTVGGETYENGVLTVSDLALSISDSEGSVTAPIGDIVLEEQGDGTVLVTMTDAYPITIEADGGSVTLNITQSNVDLVVSGTPDAMNYDVTADQYMIALGEIVDPSGESPTGEAMVALNDVSGSYTMTSGNLRDMTYDLSAGSLDMLIDLAEDSTDTDILISGKIDAFSVDADLTVPMDVDYDNPEDIFTKGLSVAATYGYGSSAYLFEITEEGSEANGSASTGTASVDVALNSDRVLYDVGVNDLAVQMSTSDLPFPIDVSMAEYGITFSAPLAATDEPQDFAAGINLTDLVVNDELWMLADPAGNLDRGPATARIDLSGQGRLFFDVTDPEQQDAMAMAAMPGEVDRLDLDALVLRFAGAQVTGEGGFTFDNTDLETFNGVPRPEGQVTIDIVGANALIDNLVAMGLLPEDQAMMGRMMMGMFAQTTGDDQLRSTIEINAEGHLLANGQRLQ